MLASLAVTDQMQALIEDVEKLRDDIDGTFRSKMAVIIDWREEDEWIVTLVGRVIAAAGDSDVTLEPFWEGERLCVRTETGTHTIPLTMSGSDRYITLHAIAAIIRGSHELRLVRETVASDTHTLYVLTTALWSALDSEHPDWTAQTFQRLETGRDYFS